MVFVIKKAARRVETLRAAFLMSEYSGSNSLNFSLSGSVNSPRRYRADHNYGVCCIATNAVAKRWQPVRADGGSPTN